MQPLLNPNSHCISEKQKPEVNDRGCSWEHVLGDSMNCFVHRSQTVTRGVPRLLIDLFTERVVPMPDVLVLTTFFIFAHQDRFSLGLLTSLLIVSPHDSVSAFFQVLPRH